MNDTTNTLDTEVLAPYLEQAIDGFGKLQEVEKFSGGQSNPTYKLIADSGEYVLRAKPPGELLKSAHQVDREYRVMKALQDTDVPVPKMLHLSQEDSPLGRMFFVMEFLPGRILWDPSLSELPEDANAERGAIYDSMNKALASLHSVDPASVGLADFGVPGSYFERQVSRWGKQYHASEVDRIDDMHQLIAFLEKEMPEDDGIVSLVQCR